MSYDVLWKSHFLLKYCLLQLLHGFYGKVVFRSESRSVWNMLTGTFSILFVFSDAPDVVCYQGRSQLVEFSISVAKLATWRAGTGELIVSVSVDDERWADVYNHLSIDSCDWDCLSHRDKYRLKCQQQNGDRHLARNERFGPASSRDRTASWPPADKAPPIRVSRQPSSESVNDRRSSIVREIVNK